MISRCRVLFSAYKAEKRSGRRAGAGSGSGGGGGAREVEGGGGSAAGGRGADAAPPPLDAHHARRYNDMAPKLVPPYALPSERN